MTGREKSPPSRREERPTGSGERPPTDSQKTWITRRLLLRGAAVGAASGLAGCNGLEITTDDFDGGSTTPTTEPPAPSSGALKLVGDELVDQRSRTHRPGLRLQVEHTGQERFETVEVEAQTADANDAPLSVLRGRGFDVDSGETFEVFVPLRSDPSTVASYRVAFTSRAGDTVATMSSLSISGDALEDDGYTKRVTGTISNAGDELGYAEVRGKFYDGAGVLLCTERDVTTSVTAGGTWDFDVEFVSDDPTAHERVTDYALEVGGQWWSL
ncbi:MAG: FxLYD domain-containing protein [Halobacteriota archaeon]